MEVSRTLTESAKNSTGTSGATIAAAINAATTAASSGASPLSVDLSSEFASVRVVVDRVGRGARLCVVDLDTGDQIFLDALQLASLCHADDEQQRAWLRTGEYRDDREFRDHPHGATDQSA